MAKGVLILGMHRSGTSALAGALQELSVYMGGNLAGPQADVNEKGFFENLDVIQLHDRCFDEMTSAWDDPLFDALNPSFRPIKFMFKEEAGKIYKKHYAQASCWGIKDPRICLFLPLWLEFFKEQQVNPELVFMVRKPDEVAASLKKRDHIGVEKAALLWIQYNLAVIKHSAGRKLHLLLFDELMKDPESQLNTLCTDLELSYSKSAAAFISGDLRHHQADEKTSENALMRLAQKMYDDLAAGKTAYEDFSYFEKELSEYRKQLPDALKEEIRAIRMSEIKNRRQFEDAYHSVWWKLAWPIKKLEKLFRGK